MDWKVNNGSDLQLEQMSAMRTQQQAKPAPRVLNQAGGREQIDVRASESIDSQAGVRTVSVGKRTLLQRAGPLLRAGQRYVPLRRSRTGGKAERTDKTEEPDEDSAFLAPVHDTLDWLAEDSGKESQEEMEAQLQRSFEPMQRYRLYFEALQMLDEKDLPARKKTLARRALNGLMSKLMEEHPQEMRRALQESDEMVATVAAMGDDLPTSVRDLRFFYGAKSKGNEDTPLTPLTMLKALIKNFGAERCLAAMMTLRSRIMSVF